MALPERNHRITLEQARELTRNHRGGAPPGAGGPFRAGAFRREIVDEILAQAGCAGLRIYMGRTATGEQTLMIVGIDADGNDLSAGTIADDTLPCPPFCTSGGLE